MISEGQFSAAVSDCKSGNKLFSTSHCHCLQTGLWSGSADVLVFRYRAHGPIREHSQDSVSSACGSPADILFLSDFLIPNIVNVVKQNTVS